MIPAESSGGERMPGELEDQDSVYDAPAARLHEIFLALRRQGFTKAQAESLIAELVTDEFSPT